MFISRIQLSNFMCFDTFDIELEKWFTFVRVKENEIGKNVLIQAIKFITSSEYINSENANKLKKEPMEDPELGAFVRIYFLIKVDENVKELTAHRAFSSINQIYFKYDGEHGVLPVERFQKIFQINLKVLLPFFDFDLYNLIDGNELFDCFNLNKLSSIARVYAKNCFLYEKKLKMGENAIRNNNEVMKALSLQKEHAAVYEPEQCVTFFINFTNTINIVFNELTSKNYSVHFFIEDDGELLSPTHSNFCDRTSNQVVTIVKGGIDEVHWSSLGGHLKCLLKIAGKIALADYFSSQLIFLDNSIALNDYQDFEFFKDDVLTKNVLQTDEEHKIGRNYLQNIVSVCKKLELVAFMEYYGRIPIKDVNIVDAKNMEFKTIEPNESKEESLPLFTGTFT